MATTYKPSVTNINRFETLAWRWMRWSGVLLIPLAFVHLLFMHIINSVYVIDYHWVIEQRWAVLGWRVYDAFLLWFGGLHGFNGLRIVINDYVHNQSTARALKWAAFVLLAIVFFVGSVALIGSPYTPNPSVPREGLLILFA